MPPSCSGLIGLEVDNRSLAPQVRCPTLVLHAREDARIPSRRGRSLAVLIPGARFVPLESRNYILVEGEPAWQQLVAELDDFLPAIASMAGNARATFIADLTARETQVLELIAQGLDNATIGARLGISELNCAQSRIRRVQQAGRQHARKGNRPGARCRLRHRPVMLGAAGARTPNFPSCVTSRDICPMRRPSGWRFGPVVTLRGSTGVSLEPTSRAGTCLADRRCWNCRRRNRRTPCKP